MAVFVDGIKNHVATQFDFEVLSKIAGKSFKSGSLILNTESPFYPKRGDEKIMRQDTKAAIILINELLAPLGDNLFRSEMGLFVASGVFIENFDKHLGHLVSVLENIKDAKDNIEKLQNIYRASPPLLALQTLTNSTMSFIAQYTGIQGNNATFGNTSHAGFHAIEEGMNEVFYNQKQALIAASNVAGEYSFLMNSTLYPSSENWFESAAVGGIILAPNESENTLCKLNFTKKLGLTPNLNHNDIEQISELNSNNFRSDALIYSGAYTADVSENDHQFYTNIHPKSISFYDEHGNAGPVNLLISMDAGIKLIKEGARKIDLIDRDIYGRFAHIQIEAL